MYVEWTTLIFSTHIQLWLSILNSNKLKYIDLERPQHTNLFTLRSGMQQMQFELHYPTSSTKEYYLSVITMSSQTYLVLKVIDNRVSTSQITRIPIQFPLQNDEMLMTSYLLTITLSSPSSLTLRINSSLQVEVTLPSEILSGDIKLSLGGSMETQSREPQGPLSVKELTQQVENGRSITLLSSLVVLKGILSPEYISTLWISLLSITYRSLLGPVYYQTGTLPPSFNGMNSLIHPDVALLEWNTKKCSVHYRIDFTPQVLPSRESWEIGSSLVLLCEWATLYGLGSPYHPLWGLWSFHTVCSYHWSRFSFLPVISACFLQVWFWICFHFSSSIHLQMRFLRDLICLVQQCHSNLCPSVSDQLLCLIIDCLSVMIRLDSTTFISLYQNDLISLLFGCLRYFPAGLYSNSISDHLVEFVWLFLSIDM